MPLLEGVNDSQPLSESSVLPVRTSPGEDKSKQESSATPLKLKLPLASVVTNSTPPSLYCTTTPGLGLVAGVLPPLSGAKPRKSRSTVALGIGWPVVVFCSTPLMVVVVAGMRISPVLAVKPCTKISAGLVSEENGGRSPTTWAIGLTSTVAPRKPAGGTTTRSIGRCPVNEPEELATLVATTWGIENWPAASVVTDALTGTLLP